MKEMGPWDGVGGGGGAAEEPECVRMAPAASRDGMRRSEKAAVPEEAQPEVRRLSGPKTSEHILTHKHKHTTTRLRLAYPLRCRGYCIEYQ